MLIVTNGRSAVGNLEAAGIPGDKLPWDDVLHDGPVPDGLDLADLSTVRARFIADCAWADLADVRDAFRRRDDRLAAATEEDEIVLWFEHDLFDQLQLVQLLDWLADPARRPGSCTLICQDAYVSNEPADALRAAFAERHDVTAAEFGLARTAWSAFRAPDPRALADLLRDDTSALPFLGGAIRRFLEEYPWLGDGLARSERQALAALRLRPGVSARDLFPVATAPDEPKYLADQPFFRYLDGLARDPYPLVAADPSGGLQLTRTGEQVIDRKADRLRLRGVDRWYGGVRLTGGNLWRWNPDEAAVEAE